MQQRFLLTTAPAEATHEALKRMAYAAREGNARPIETILTDDGRAYTFVAAPDEQSVRQLATNAGLQVADIQPAEIVYTDLLDEPHRAR